MTLRGLKSIGYWLVCWLFYWLLVVFTGYFTGSWLVLLVTLLVTGWFYWLLVAFTRGFQNPALNLIASKPLKPSYKNPNNFQICILFTNFLQPKRKLNQTKPNRNRAWSNRTRTKPKCIAIFYLKSLIIFFTTFRAEFLLKSRSVFV